MMAVTKTPTKLFS